MQGQPNFMQGGMGGMAGSTANMGGAQMPGGMAQAMQGSPAPQPQMSALQQAQMASNPQMGTPQQLSMAVDPTRQGMDLNSIYENFLNTLNSIRGSSTGQAGDVMQHPQMQQFMQSWLGQGGQQQGQPQQQVQGQTPQGAPNQQQERQGPMRGTDMSRYNTVMATSRGGDMTSAFSGTTVPH